MSELVSLDKVVYGQSKVQEVIDRNFKYFGQEKAVAEKTVEQFFQDYEDLYYKIPAEGSTNSHQYLIEKSSQLYSSNTFADSIQPLIDEITQLKAQTVSDAATIVDLRIKLAEYSATDN